jgi:D-beta-D-heptose 7-phosphate kinase/D-beta-D-heptose 1-phosphate adenosyltransferase
MENQILKEFLKRNQQKRLNIHCVGDAIVDEFFFVKINRISPEHPIPVMLCQNNIIRKPGGAANVAYQLQHLNVETQLICFSDLNADKVFSDHKIKLLSYSPEFFATLPVKRRYLDNGIQVAPRHDMEIPLCGLSLREIGLSIQLMGYYVEMQKPDVVILSDYAKGFFANPDHNIMDYYKNVVTIVDTKSGDLDRWKGCTIFKPNAKEAQELSGYTNWQDQASYFYDKLECEAVAITFGGEKVAGKWHGEFFQYLPNKKVVVESVIGAGDCFAAFFATATGHGFNPIESAEIAWNAGAIYVQQRMNRPVVPAELSEDKIVEPEDLKNRDFKLVFTNGCFDILHKGHLQTLKFAKSKGDKLVVALNTDDSIKRFKDINRPVVPLEHRMAVMAGLEFVDFVVCFDEETPLEIIKKIQPDVLVKGGDYEIENMVGSNIVPEVYKAPLLPNSSTTKILNDFFKSKND